MLILYYRGKTMVGKGKIMLVTRIFLFPQKFPPRLVKIRVCLLKDDGCKSLFVHEMSVFIYIIYTLFKATMLRNLHVEHLRMKQIPCGVRIEETFRSCCRGLFENTV